MNTEKKDVRWYHYLLSFLGFGKKYKPKLTMSIDFKEDEEDLNIPVKHHYKCEHCNSDVTVTGEYIKIKPSELHDLKMEGKCRFCNNPVSIEVIDDRYKPL